MAPSLTVAVDTDSAAKVLVMVHSCTRSDHRDCTAYRVERAARSCRVRSWYAHMVLIHLSEFGAEAARGLVLPTLFTYVQELGGGLEEVGLLTALFSVGRFFSSLLFGWLCDRTSFRVLYNVAGACSVLGNLMYVLPYSSSVRNRTLLALSRLVIGFGAGNRSVCRANIAMLTRVDQRLEYFTLFATVVFLAYALTPGLGSVIGETQIEIATDLLQFNRFTAPGFLLVALNLFTILVNNLVYDESISRDDARGSPKVIASVPVSSESTKPNVNELTIVVDKLEKSTEKVAEKKPTQEVMSPILSDQAVTVGMLVFIFLNFITRGILSIFETVNVPLFLQLTNRNTIQEQDSVEATRDASTFYLVIGLLGLISYGSVHVLRKKVPDTGFLLFGFAMLLVGNAILLTVCAGMQLNNERSDDADHSQQQFDIFATAEVFVWSVGCPLTSAVVVSAFSKVLGSRPQGLLMGVFGASASVARMVLPFLPSLLASWPLLFLVNMVLCAVCILVLSLYLGFISSHGDKTDGRSTVVYDSVQLHSDGREAD
uniref:Major facilitator superfamily (MFS) profile domain-containing protein n=1 Tax=Peronospora matthiolae TaxID=2874970 RepID=A0AAV1UCW3_9STRA